MGLRRAPCVWVPFVLFCFLFRQAWGAPLWGRRRPYPGTEDPWAPGFPSGIIRMEPEGAWGGAEVGATPKGEWRTYP